MLVLVLASPDGVEGAKAKKKKTKKQKVNGGAPHADGDGAARQPTGKMRARPSRRVDDDTAPFSAAVNDSGDERLFRKEPIPETRDDALVFHSESTPESRWSWRNTKKHFTRAWDGLSDTANTFAEKLHLPSKREREMVWYYARLIGDRFKEQWDAINWEEVAEEIPEVKGFRKTWAEFQNVTGVRTGWKGALLWPLSLLWAVTKWTAWLLWSLATSPFTTAYRVVRWLTSTWWSTLLSVVVGWILYEGTEVKLKVQPQGMPALPEGAEEMRTLPRSGYFTLDNYPKNLRGRQVHAKDLWAHVKVSKGRLQYRALADPGEGNVKEKELTYMNGGAIVPPQFPFELAPIDGERNLKFRMVVYKAPPEGASIGPAGDTALSPSSPAPDKPGTSTYKFTLGKRR